MSVMVILVLYLIGVGLIVAEVFLPGAVAGIVGGLMVLGSIGGAFAYHGTGLGLGLLGVSAILGVVVVKVVLRRLSHRDVQSAASGYRAYDAGLEALVGAHGTAATPLRPVGTARIGGKPVTVQTRGEMLEAGVALEVLRVEGNKVLVRAREAAE